MTFALVELDNNGDNKFSAVCEKRGFSFRKGLRGKIYTDLITGEKIIPSEKAKNGKLTYSVTPKIIPFVQAATLVHRIRCISEDSYCSIINDAKNKALAK